MKEQLESRISELREHEHNAKEEMNYLRLKLVEKEKEFVSINGGIIELNILLKKLVNETDEPPEPAEELPVEPAKP